MYMIFLYPMVPMGVAFQISYFLVVTLWGEQVYRLGQQHVGIGASENFSNSLEFLLAFNPVSLVQHIWTE